MLNTATRFYKVHVILSMQVFVFKLIVELTIYY